jgi:subtilisin family serine protease
VDVSAPGEGIITTYPGETYAGTYGTSFAAPLVSGAAALVLEMNPSATPDEVKSVIMTAKRLPREELGAGRLDLGRALEAARVIWPNAAWPEPVASCEATGTDWTPAQ